MRRPFDDRDFVQAWQKGENVAQIADALGLSYFVTTTRAARLRKLGVPLKLLNHRKGPRRNVDVQGLIRLAKSAAKT